MTPGARVVIGVGNVYRRDDGVGPAVVERLGTVPGARVLTCLGGTAELIDLWAGTDLAVLVDAVRAVPAMPGRVHRLTLPASAAVVGRPPGSSHAAGLGEAVALAEALDRLPRRLVLYAVEVEDVGHGLGLSPSVSGAVPAVARAIARDLA